MKKTWGELAAARAEGEAVSQPTGKRWPRLKVEAFISPEAWAIIATEPVPRFVAEVRNSAEAKGYADLFAAAPDLYWALEALICGHCCDRVGSPHSGGCARCWPARAALAKARGEAAEQ